MHERTGTIVVIDGGDLFSLAEYLEFGTIASFSHYTKAWYSSVFHPQGGFEVKPADTSSNERTASDLRWVFEVASARDREGAKFVGKVIDGVNRLIAANEFQKLDQTLAHLPKETASEYVLVAFARSTFPVRLKLKKWNSFVLSTKRAFMKRGLNADRLLKGLI